MWSRFSLGIISTTHTVVEMTKFSVCVTKGHKRLFLWPAFVALSNGMHEIRDEIFVDLLVLLVYQLI